jgi:hypothetical protein
LTGGAHIQVGTIVDDPLEQNNLSKGQRRATLTEQLLVDAELTHTRKRRFNKLQVRTACSNSTGTRRADHMPDMQ